MSQRQMYLLLVAASIVFAIIVFAIIFYTDILFGGIDDATRKEVLTYVRIFYYTVSALMAIVFAYFHRNLIN